MALMAKRDPKYSTTKTGTALGKSPTRRPVRCSRKSFSSAASNSGARQDVSMTSVVSNKVSVVRMVMAGAMPML